MDSLDDPHTTPRPPQGAFDDQSELKTPTRDTFASATGPYPPPPYSPTDAAMPHSTTPTTTTIGRSASQKSEHSAGSGDLSMADSMAPDASDNESMTSEPNRQKKKKGQRFYCTDFPPCNLSFTRSEHLARHIRKHTGERPFQCHCLRRFSRLDNLRQHAQTVHLNEDIPSDSLAATGTRFQRQIRTDRVRPPAGRARAATLGSQGHRGHSRNISGSSIGSVSDFGTPDRQRLALETMGPNAAGPDHPYYPYYTQNNGYSSPTPVTPADHNGPVAHSGLQSPIAMVPRGMTWAEPLHSRRMSVPSAHVMQSPSSYSSNTSYLSPVASSSASTFSTNASSIITSPTSSTFSDQQTEFGSDDPRRRTWHPGTYNSYAPRPATSGLSYYQTPDAPKPVPTTQSAAAQSVRLPGIDSFDRAGQKPAAPPLRALSPMELDVPSPRRAKFDIDHEPRERPPRYSHAPSQSAPQSLEMFRAERMEMDSPITPRRQKRQAWYNGPLLQTQEYQLRTSPGSSSGDGPQTPPTTSAVDYQPAIIHSNGYVEALPTVDEPKNIEPLRGPAHFDDRRNRDMDRLDALVAVATSESHAER